MQEQDWYSQGGLWGTQIKNRMDCLYGPFWEFNSKSEIRKKKKKNRIKREIFLKLKFGETRTYAKVKQRKKKTQKSKTARAGRMEIVEENLIFLS